MEQNKHSALFLAGSGWRSGYEGQQGPLEPDLQAHGPAYTRFTVSSKTAGVTLAVTEMDAKMFCVWFYSFTYVYVYSHGMHAEVCGYIKTGFMPALCHYKLHQLLSRCFHFILLLQPLFLAFSTLHLRLRILCYL